MIESLIKVLMSIDEQNGTTSLVTKLANRDIAAVTRCSNKNIYFSNHSEVEIKLINSKKQLGLVKWA